MTPLEISDIVRQSVQHELKILVPYLDQGNYIKKLAKWQVAEMLNYKVKNLKAIATNGKKMSDGLYYKLTPDANGHYNYVDVLKFKNLKDGVV